MAAEGERQNAPLRPTCCSSGPGRPDEAPVAVGQDAEDAGTFDS